MSTKREFKDDGRDLKSSPLAIGSQLLLAAILATLSLHSNAFGTLLTSPAERALLDNRRQNSELNPQPMQHFEAVVPNKTISLEGLVARQKGPVSIWLNGQLHDKGTTGLSLSARAKGGLSVSLPSAQGRVRLKPGQQIESDNGELSDTYQRQVRSFGDKPVVPLDAEPESDNLPQIPIPAR